MCFLNTGILKISNILALSRLLLTSSKAVRRLLRRNEMHGWNQRALDQEAHDQRVVSNIRKKWGIAPALTVEFVAYYHDR